VNWFPSVYQGIPTRHMPGGHGSLKLRLSSGGQALAVLRTRPKEEK